MPIAILLYFLCTKHVSDINISIIRSLRLCCWINTLFVLFLFRCVLEIWCTCVWVVPVLQAEARFSLQHGHYSSLTAPNPQRTANQERYDQCGNQHHSRELLTMGIVMPETCSAHKKYNKIKSGIYLFSFFFKLNKRSFIRMCKNLKEVVT